MNFWRSIYILRTVCLFYILCETHAIPNVSLSPVILVPGIGGNILKATVNKQSTSYFWCQSQSRDYNIWLNPSQMFPLLIDCWVDNMKLFYDNITRKTKNAPGVEINVPGWGTVSTMDIVEGTSTINAYNYGYYFYYIIHALTGHGYDSSKNLYGAPYDFRKGPNEQTEWFQNVKELTEKAYNDNGQTRVTYITHSMGGRMILHFLQQMTMEWKEKYIEQMIALSTPWGGSVQALQAIASGYDFGSSVLQNEMMKEVQETCPSVVWLLPSKYFWKDHEVLVKMSNQVYTTKNISDFFNAINNPYINEIAKDLEKYFDFTAPGVNLHCLYGKNMGDSVESLDFGSKYNMSPKLTLGDGDGTVNLRSLIGCTYFRRSEKYNVYHKAFPNVEHYNLLSDNRVINYVISRLTKVNQSTVDHVLSNLKSFGKLRFF